MHLCISNECSLVNGALVGDCKGAIANRAEAILRIKMVEVAGVEPASLVLSYGASTCLVMSLLSLPKRLMTGYSASRLSKYNR